MYTAAAARSSPGAPAAAHSSPTRVRADLAVFDAAGRKVRTLLRQEVEPGIRRVLWEGDDDGGNRVPGGIYFVRLRAGSATLSEKVVRLQ